MTAATGHGVRVRDGTVEFVESVSKGLLPSFCAVSAAGLLQTLINRMHTNPITAE